MTDEQGTDNTGTRRAGRSGPGGAAPAGRTFEDLNTFEKLIASLFMLLAQTLPDDPAPEAGTGPATDEAAGSDANPDSGPGALEQFIAAVLGFNLAEDRDAVRDWRRNLSDNWRETQDFSNFDFNRAEERIIGRDFRFGNRQEAVMSVMDDAAGRAGISKDFMVGLWGIESDFGNNLVSPSGCRGDWQFTQRTFASIITGYGDRIADHLRQAGHEEAAAQVLRAKNSGAGLQALRDDPYISTYAAAYYVKDVAATLDIDPNNPGNWGALYAGYNIGPGNARKLTGSLANTENVGSRLGSVAAWNPGFFANGETGMEALRNYQGRIIANLERFNSNTMAGQYAQAASGQTIAATEPIAGEDRAPAIARGAQPTQTV